MRVTGWGRARARERARERHVPVSFFSLHVFSALQFFHNFSLLLLLAELLLLLLFSSSSWLLLWWWNYSALLLLHLLFLLLHLLLLARARALPLALLHLRGRNFVAVGCFSRVGFSLVLSLSLSRPRWSKKAYCRRRFVVVVSSSSSSFCRYLLR